MRDFTENLESLGDIQDKYPQGTLVLRAQYVYMLQNQFRDLERDYRKISEMYAAEIEKAAKLELQINTLGQGETAKISELKADKTFVFGEECEAYKKSEADKVIADLEESHKKEVEQLLIEIAELKERIGKERSEKVDYKISANDLSYGLAKAFEDNRKLKRALYKACANWARSEQYTEATWHGDKHREELWANVQAKCLKKADEAK